MKLQDHLDIAMVCDRATLERRLIEYSRAQGFGRVSALVASVDALGRTRFDVVGNTPTGFAALHSAPDRGGRCPVMQHLRISQRPVVYDQSTYLRSGAIELWEEQAQFGYRCGVAVAMHLPDDRHFAIGLDREEPISRNGDRHLRLMADLLLVASWTVDTALTLLVEVDPGMESQPRLTKRELEVLRWTLAGKSAWVVGEIMGLAVGTVNFHTRNAMAKLGASSKHVAAMRAVRMGLICP